MPTIKSHDGAEIYYETGGAGSTPLIFLHGWGGSRRTWDGVLPQLDDARFRAIFVDLRGHGQSDQPDKGYTWAGFDQDVIAVVDREKVPRFILVGFSMGGKLACYMAARHPDRILAQILVAPAPPGTVPIEREAGLQFCRGAADTQVVRGVFGSWFGPAAAEEIVDACCETIARAPCPVLEATAEMTLWTSMETAIGRLALPSLLVFGRSDPVYGEAFQRQRMLPFLSNVRMVPVNSGHFIPLECAADLAGLIEEYIPSLLGSR